jgi:hypothetical protein
MLSKTKKLTKGGDNIGRIVIMEFKAQDSTAFDDMLAFVKQHPDFEKLEISYLLLYLNPCECPQMLDFTGFEGIFNLRGNYRNLS